MPESTKLSPASKAPTRVVTILVNERCPLRCRHCSVGFSETNHGTNYRIGRDVLSSMIAAIDRTVYCGVVFAGGEPSLDPELVKLGIDLCKQAGLAAGMVSAPVWAATDVTAKRLLEKVNGLNWLFLSYDAYHLEFLDFKHYETATRSAVKQGVSVTFHLTYSCQSERESLLNSLAPIRHLVDVNAASIVPVGNAQKEVDREKKGITIQSIQDFDALPRGCMAGNVLVDSKFAVHGCCWAATRESSPLSFADQDSRLVERFHKMEANLAFRAILQKGGFLGAMSAKAREVLLSKVKGRSFVSECDLCLAVMGTEFAEIWSSCQPTPSGTPHFDKQADSSIAAVR
jgi:organic radical activating enzyme